MKMSYEEKTTILQIIIAAGINIWLILEIRQLYSDGLMDGPAAIQIWAETVFWIIMISIIVGIALTVIGTVLFAIIERVIFGDKAPVWQPGRPGHPGAEYANGQSLGKMEKVRRHRGLQC